MCILDVYIGLQRAHDIAGQDIWILRYRQCESRKKYVNMYDIITNVFSRDIFPFYSCGTFFVKYKRLTLVVITRFIFFLFGNSTKIQLPYFTSLLYIPKWSIVVFICTMQKYCCTAFKSSPARKRQLQIVLLLIMVSIELAFKHKNVTTIVMLTLVYKFNNVSDRTIDIESQPNQDSVPQ